MTIAQLEGEVTRLTAALESIQKLRGTLEWLADAIVIADAALGLTAALEGGLAK